MCSPLCPTARPNGSATSRLVHTLKSPLGVLIGTMRDPPESTSRGSQVEVSNYEPGVGAMGRRLDELEARSYAPGEVVGAEPVDLLAGALVEVSGKLATATRLVDGQVVQDPMQPGGQRRPAVEGGGPFERSHQRVVHEMHLPAGAALLRRHAGQDGGGVRATTGPGDVAAAVAQGGTTHGEHLSAEERSAKIPWGVSWSLPR